MTTTRETEVVVTDAEVRKTALHPRVRTRLAFEALCLTGYADSPHLPELRDYDAETHTLTMARVRGQSFREVFAVDEAWNGVPKPWSDAKPYLAQYIEAETDLLSRGLMYRDLNLDHLIFTGDKAVLVDHEETLGNDPSAGKWYYKSQRGTWETMSPEEFRGYGYLTERTATYRAGVLAYVALTGSLPFPRFPQRQEVHRWRKRRVARVDEGLPKLARQTLKTALRIKPDHRQASPANFFNELTASYEDQ